MKFLATALAGLALSFGIESEAKKLTAKQLNKRLQTGKVNKKALLRHAVPYKHGDKPGERKLNGEWEITGEYSIQFNTCLHLTAYNEDLFDDDIIAYAKAGTATSIKSYVIFNMCLTEDCYYEDDENLYMIDLETYIASVIEYYPAMEEAYCEACEDSYEVCYPEEEENNEEENDEEEDNDEERKLKLAERKLSRRKGRRLVEYVDCNTCAEKGCFDGMDEDEEQEDDEDAIDDMDVAEWIANLAECYETEYQMNDLDLYAGLTCNSEGTGVEIGVFLDENCMVYYNQKSYKNIISYEDQQYYEASSNLMTTVFTELISCENVEYQELQDEDEEDDNQEDEEDDNEANDYCGNLFDEDTTRSLDDCDGNDSQDDDNDEDAEEQDQNYDWFVYNLSENDQEDPAAVCNIIVALEGEYTSVYDAGDDASGSMYDYTVEDEESAESSGIGNAGKIIGIIALIAVIALGGFFAFKYFTKKSKDDKRTALVNRKSGTMA